MGARHGPVAGGDPQVNQRPHRQQCPPFVAAGVKTESWKESFRLTTTEYPNCVGNSTGGARCVVLDKALVCCKDSAASVRQRMIEFGCSLVGAVLLSVRDTPSLNSIEAIVGALPYSIRLLMVDDIEYLLPPDQRNATSVLRLISRISAFAAERGLYASVSCGIDLLDELTHGGAR